MGDDELHPRREQQEARRREDHPARGTETEGHRQEDLPGRRGIADEPGLLLQPREIDLPREEAPGILAVPADQVPELARGDVAREEVLQALPVVVGGGRRRGARRSRASLLPEAGGEFLEALPQLVAVPMVWIAGHRGWRLSSCPVIPSYDVFGWLVLQLVVVAVGSAVAGVREPLPPVHARHPLLRPHRIEEGGVGVRLNGEVHRRRARDLPVLPCPEVGATISQLGEDDLAASRRRQARELLRER